MRASTAVLLALPLTVPVAVATDAPGASADAAPGAGPSPGSPALPTGPTASGYTAQELSGSTRLIVTYETNVDDDAKLATVEATIDDVTAVTDLGGSSVAVELAQTADASDLTELMENPLVKYVEPDSPVYLTETALDPESMNPLNWAAKGPKFEWGSNPVPHGSNTIEAWRKGLTGSRDVYVAVMDTGMDIAHPELVEQIWVNGDEIPGNAVDDDRNGFVDDVNGWSVVTNSAEITPSNGSETHATRVAGVVGAKGGNGIAASGVNWNVGIIPIRVFHPFRVTSNSTLIGGVNYVTHLKRDKGVNIVAINASLGGAGFSNGLLNAINAAGDQGILFVASAGNDGRDNATKATFPASYQCVTPSRPWDCMISVAAHREDGNLANFSNYGATVVDLSAPGESVLTIGPYSNQVVTAHGTSFSAPYVSGAIALCSSLDPSLSPEQILSALHDTTRTTPALTGKVATNGHLDVNAMAERCRGISGVTAGIDSLTLTGRQTVRVNGWTVGDGPAAQNVPTFVVDGVEAAASSLRITPSSVKRAAFTAELPVANGLRDVCVAGADGIHTECERLFVPAQTKPFGEMRISAKRADTWSLYGWALDPADAGTWLGAPYLFERPKVFLYVDGVKNLWDTTHDLPELSFFPSETYVGWDSRERDFLLRWSPEPGLHTACLVVESHDGRRRNELGCFEHVEIAGDNPIGGFESITRLSNAEARVSGWALDPNEDDLLDVQVFVNNRMVTVGQTGTARNDINERYKGYQVAAGYDLTVPLEANAPRNNVCVWAMNKGRGAGNTLLGCRAVENVGGNPVGNLEVARQDGPGNLRITGWAHDPDTSAPINVRVTVNRWGKGTVAADGERPDVKQAFSTAGDSHGFNATVSTRSAGPHNVCVYAMNTGIGTTDTLLGCRTVNVVRGNPLGAVDGMRQSGSGAVRVQGWSLDPDTVDAVDLHVYANGRFHSVRRANTSRADVGRAYPGYGNDHGYDFTLTGLRGRNDLCVFAINRGAGATNPLLGCRTVTVP